jgi:hypothetical protein
MLSFIFGFTQNYQYLGGYSGNGTPNYLESPGDVVSVETLELIDSAFPETFRVTTCNPHYITSNYDTELSLTSQTEVFVTFVSEGAGYRNVLGFYTYDTNSPLSSAPSDNDITIVFPNISALGSGGGLQTGDKVSIGTFPAGTSIGWILLSNGWNGSQVGYGYWQLYSNPNFNPETNPSLRQHNVLIKDDTNELVVLGFEDIRRDHNWCDHDFNDALFYVSATDYNAINTNNSIDVSTSTDVYSSNLAGFESNGDLANLVAKRNFNRAKTNTHPDRKDRQKLFDKKTYRSSSNIKESNNLANYFPDSGMFGSEIPLIATPEDLPQYANADDVFALDYYSNNSRESAALLTVTSERIYDHSKTICDRLNGSTLKDVRNVTIKNHEMVFSIIERDNGFIEYAVHFSVKTNQDNYEIFSYWNINDYPLGDFMNFQVWGKTMGQVSHIVNHIFDNLALERDIVSEPVTNRVPEVFISSGYYRNKQIHLEVINKTRASMAETTINFSRTEQSDREDLIVEIPLSGAWNESITIDTDYIFDLGMSFRGENALKSDALYLADGPWGIDYLTEQTTVTNFDIHEQEDELDETLYQVERYISTSGEMKGTFNIFRNILPGDLVFKTNDYQDVQFYVLNNKSIEVILVPENLDNWENRLRFSIPENNQEKLFSIPFESFVNSQGIHDPVDGIKSIVFSMKGDFSNYEDFDVSIRKLAFGLKPEIIPNALEITRSFNYPNPFSNETTIAVPEKTRFLDLEVYDMLGRKVYSQIMKTNDDEKTSQLSINNLQKGIYKYKVVDDFQNEYIGSFLIK